MFAVILAAGRGTRMRSLTDNVSKVMLPILEKPKLAYSIECLPEKITHVVLVINYFGDQIIDHFGEIYNGKKIHYVWQTALNGTAGALYDCKEILAGEDTFLVINGDDLYRPDDLETLIQHKQAMMGIQTDKASQYGLLNVQNGVVVGILEKDPMATKGIINTGAYMVNKTFFATDMVKISETEYGLPHTLLAAGERNPVMYVEAQDWFPIGDPQAYQEAGRVIERFLRTQDSQMRNQGNNN